MSGTRIFIAIVVLLVIGGLVLVFARTGRKDDGKTVVVYTSVDIEHSAPVLKRFEEETGIKVVARTDTEASKTVGLVNRLIEMKDSPDGDVFWNNEAAHSAKLAELGVLTAYKSPGAADIPDEFKDPQDRFTGFGCRGRVLIYNTKSVPAAEAPRSVLDLADPKWKGRVCMARPTRGTTKSHVVALWLKLGEEKATAFFRGLKENGVALLPGNATVRDRVGDGTYAAGMTDTDDAYSGIERKLPIEMVVPDQTGTLAKLPDPSRPGETLEVRFPDESPLGIYLIPNTVGLIRGGPHPETARRFVDYLLQASTEQYLAEHGARQTPVRESVPAPKGVLSIAGVKRMAVPGADVYSKLDVLSAKIDAMLQ